jgi:VWFA-related protein
VAYIGVVCVVALAASAQSTTSWHEGSTPIIQSTSTLVLVPTLVRSASGEHVADLDASYFRLTDNGVEQKISVEPADNRPIAIVVLMQTGGEAFNYLHNYEKLDSEIDAMLLGATRKVALVTFGSRPEQIWNFPPMVDALDYFLTHPKGGDHGAAILDAVNCAIGLLQQQPAGFRRIILLIGQAADNGSKAHAEDVLRGLTESGTTIYSLTFPQAAVSRRSAEKILFTSELGFSLQAVRENTAASLAAVSGGEQRRFHDEHDLETGLLMVGDDIHKGYTLSFYPTSHQSGLHSVTVRVVKGGASLKVTSRTNYWFDGKTD